MYRTVFDLNRAEIEELKEAYFLSDETDDEILGGISAPCEIPDEVIYRHYNGFYFVTEDFFCNAYSKNGK